MTGERRIGQEALVDSPDTSHWRLPLPHERRAERSRQVRFLVRLAQSKEGVRPGCAVMPFFLM